MSFIRKWSKEMLNLLELDEVVLPKVYESWQIIGKVSENDSKETGLSMKTSVIIYYFYPILWGKQLSL